MSTTLDTHYLTAESGSLEKTTKADAVEDSGCSTCGACLVIPLLLFLIGVLIGPIAWMYLENIAASDPALAFDVVEGCELSATSHEVEPALGTAPCFDKFTFFFSPPGTSTVFKQEQFVRVVPDALCADVNASRPTQPLGTYPCNRARSAFEPYRGAFNCATPTSNVEEPCFTLLIPTTTHDPTTAFVVGPIVLVGGCVVGSAVLTRVFT